MKNIGLKIAMIAIFVNAPRFVITFLAADGMRFPSWVEGAMLAITGIATGVVLTGGGAYIAHELIAMKGRAWTRAFMTVCCVRTLYPRISEWGNPRRVNAFVLQSESIGLQRERGELKHLSNPRKRNDSQSSGERNGRSPNHSYMLVGL